MKNNFVFSQNESLKRFELLAEGKIAFIEYIINNENILFLTHTEVPRELEGKGIGSTIVANVLEYAKENNYTIAPLCPFVASYIKRHQEWTTILAKGFNI